MKMSITVAASNGTAFANGVAKPFTAVDTVEEITGETIMIETFE